MAIPKFLINGFDLTDVQGLQDGEPRFYLGAGTELPQPPKHRGFSVARSGGSGSLLPSHAYTSTALIPVAVIVTDLGPNGPSENLMLNQELIRSILYSRPFPVLTYWPGFSIDAVEDETELPIYTAECAIKGGLQWQTLTSAPDPQTSVLRFVLEAPLGMMHSQWAEFPVQAGAVTNGLRTYARCTDWLLLGAPVATEQTVVVEVSTLQEEETTSIELTVPANCSWVYSQDHRAAYVLAEGEALPEALLEDSPLHSQAAYELWLNELFSKPGEWVSVTQGAALCMPNAASGRWTFSVDAEVEPALTLAYRDRKI